MTHKYIKQLAFALLLGVMPLTISSAMAAASGPAGPKGATGPAGPKGATGPAGPKGATGPAGPKGATGATGPAGVAGPAGATGLIGPAGATGLIGPAGVAGPTGPAGASATSCTPYRLGDIGPDGGKVFYIDGSGCHGLEAQIADAAAGEPMDWTTAISTSAAYNDSSNLITGAAGFNCSTTDAQLTPYCWHLPSKTELEYLFEQKDVVGGFSSGYLYWSSTGSSSTNAWSQNFVIGNQPYGSKANTASSVRAVRTF